MRLLTASFCRPLLKESSPPCMRTHMHLLQAPVSEVQPPWYVLRYFVLTATMACLSSPIRTLLQAALWAEEEP